MAKPKKPQTFPVMDGAQSAPREDQVAGIVCDSLKWPRDDGLNWPHFGLAGVVVTV
jgi:hypothetical protein